MVQEENSQPDLEALLEARFTPEPCSQKWDSDPIGFLEMPFSFPYRPQEWDAIFAKLLDLLKHQDRWIWNWAIDKLIEALKVEKFQSAKRDDYQPSKIDERVRGIFEAIATQSLNQPGLFEAFCSKFQFLGSWI